MTLYAALTTEVMKLRRCKVTWATLGGFSIAPLGIALFMWIVREPERAADMGLLGAKAELAGIEATWPSYMSMMTIIAGIGGMILLSFIVAYIFGREYTEGTAKNMLALPVGRHWFVVAKLAVAAAWWMVLVAAVLAESLVIGTMLGLPDVSAGVIWAGIGHALLAAAISYLLVPVIAWITTVGRGYMPPLGFAIAMMGLGNLFGKTGWSDWFPWSIVPNMVGMVGQPKTLPTGSYVVVALTFAIGVAATMAQLRYADNAQ